MTPLEAIREAARESRERESKATPGPWESRVEKAYGTETRGLYVPRPDGGWRCVANVMTILNGEADFIAAARTELGQWREATERLTEALDDLTDAGLAFSDPRVSYEEWQINRGAMERARKALAAVAEKLKGGRG